LLRTGGGITIAAFITRRSPNDFGNAASEERAIAGMVRFVELPEK
jgi:hypothetical protein